MTTTTTNREVTEVQLDKTHRIYNEATKQVCYRVENSRGDVDEEGNVIEYTVAYSPATGLTCTCPAGNPPTDIYGQPKYAPRDCWHRRAAVEHARQYREARQAEQEGWQAQAVEEITAEVAPVIEENKAAVQAAKHERNAVRRSGKNAYQSKPFSLMR